MIALIFERVEHLTYNYHSDGGLVIIAADEIAARDLFDQYANEDPSYSFGDEEKIGLSEDEWEAAQRYELGEDGVEPRLFVFPDAGCC